MCVSFSEDERYQLLTLSQIVWLQSAPTAFANIGWHYYLFFIIPGTIGAVIIWFYFPDTLGLPLEEVAAIFGDSDEVATYMRDIEITEDELDKVGGFGHGSGEKEGTLQIEKIAQGIDEKA